MSRAPVRRGDSVTARHRPQLGGARHRSDATSPVSFPERLIMTRRLVTRRAARASSTAAMASPRSAGFARSIKGVAARSTAAAAAAIWCSTSEARPNAARRSSPRDASTAWYALASAAASGTTLVRSEEAREARSGSLDRLAASSRSAAAIATTMAAADPAAGPGGSAASSSRKWATESSVRFATGTPAMWSSRCRLIRAARRAADAVRMRASARQRATICDQVLLSDRTAVEPAFEDLARAGSVPSLRRQG